MSDYQNLSDPRQAAFDRLRAKRHLYTNVISYFIVNAFLVAVWALNGDGYFWPVWVMASWGIGLAFQAWHIFGERPITEQDLRREMTRGAGVVPAHWHQPTEPDASAPTRPYDGADDETLTPKP